MDDPNEQIGFLVKSRHVLCRSCAGPPDMSPTIQGPDDWRSPLFRVNIGSYGQHCHECGAELVKPCTPLWPELFAVWLPERGYCPPCAANMRDGAPQPRLTAATAPAAW